MNSPTNRPYLLTPILKERDMADKRYNICHIKKTRCLVERAIGQLKMRFRCLDKTGGCMMTTPQRSAQVIIACSVLHNMCIRNKLPLIGYDTIRITCGLTSDFRSGFSLILSFLTALF